MSGAESWVLRLRPSDGTGDHSPACHPETWNRAVAALGLGPSQWVVEFGHELSHLAVRREVPAARRAAAASDARPVAEAVVLHALMALSAGKPVFAEVPLEMAVPLAAAVRQRVPLEEVLKYQRESHARVGQALIEQFVSLVPLEEQSEGLATLTRFLVDFVAGLAEMTSAAYAVEEQTWLGSVDGQRGEVVRGILRGDRVGDESIRRLAYDLVNRTHLGVVIYREGPEVVGLDRLAASLLVNLGATGQLIIHASSEEVWAWGSFVSPPAATVVTPAGLPPRVQIAMGRPARGIEGFRRTHSEAATAATVARLSPLPAVPVPVKHFADVRLISLLLADPIAADEFVRDELGPLAVPREAHLRETVRVYLECNCSPAAAASQLNVVKNTIVYRIHRAEELLGHSVKDRGGTLWVALHLANAVGLREVADA